MNRKGQALVEFVLILPLFLFMIMSIYDFGMIFSRKNRLSNISNDVVTLFKNGKNIDELNELYDEKISISVDSEYYALKISDSLELITPGFSKIFGNPYNIEIVRYIPYE